MNDDHYLNTNGVKAKIKKYEYAGVPNLENEEASTISDKHNNEVQFNTVHNGSKDHKPWLRESGEHKELEELRECCKYWSATIWEKYLKTLEKNICEKNLKDPLTAERVKVSAYEKIFRGPANLNHFQELRKLFIAALEKVPLIPASILKLRFVDDLNINQISRLLDMKSDLTRSYFFRGLRRLEKNMDDQHVKKLRLIHQKRILKPDSTEVVEFH